MCVCGAPYPLTKTIAVSRALFPPPPILTMSTGSDESDSTPEETYIAYKIKTVNTHTMPYRGLFVVCFNWLISDLFSLFL